MANLVTATSVILAVALGVSACGSGSDDTTYSNPVVTPAGDTSNTDSGNHTTNCYFNDGGVNLGTVGSEEGEEAAAETLARKDNITINNCNGSVVNSDTDTETNTTSDSNNPTDNSDGV